MIAKADEICSSSRYKNGTKFPRFLCAPDRFGDPEEDRCMPRAKYPVDRGVDDYIKSLPSWQQKVCWQVRDLVHAADAEVSETIKRTKLPYFTLDGNICAFLGAKDHVNIFIYDPIAPDPEGIINQGQGNSAARAIQVHEGEAINKRALLNLFRATTGPAAGAACTVVGHGSSWQ